MSGQKKITRHLPHFFRTEDTENLFYRFVDVFGAMLDGGEDGLIALMRAHWVDTADNEGSKGLDTNQKGDLDKMLTLYLEALGGTSLLRQTGRRDGAEGLLDDAVYRERMKHLIKILREGASTLQGIREIVAANLGIFGDSPEAVAARESIEIIEYLPREVVTSPIPSALFQVFWIKNPNQETTPVEITITTNPTPGFPFRQITLEELTTEWQTRMKWTGAEAELDGGESHELVISGMQLAHNDVPVPDANVDFPLGPIQLPPGVSYWRIYTTVGEFGHTVPSADEADYVAEHPQRSFDNTWAIFAPSGPQFNTVFRYTRFRPASFQVRIPWALPGGYAELLDQQPDNPRLQIPYIVNRVKAAGVWTEVAYQMNIAENLDLQENFGTETDDQVYEEEQPMSDDFYFGGVFDVARYDQSLFQ